MSRIRTTLGLTVLLASIVLSSLSPTPALAAEGRKALVARIVKLQQADVENIARALTNQAMQPRLQAINQALGRVAQDKREALAKEIQADLRKAGSEIETVLRERGGKLAPAVLSAGLDEKFSEDELRQIATWLESPAARKFQQYATEAQGALIQKLVAESRAQIEPKLQTLDQKIKAHFAAVGVPARNPASDATAPK